MEKLHIFDGNAFFGMRSLRLPGSFYKKEDLLRKMDEYGIEKALVYHSMAKEYDPQVGNQILLDEIGTESRLVPMWSVLPHYTGEFDPPEVLADKMKRYGIKAVTMFPSPASQNFSFSDLTCGAIYEMLEHYDIPLFIGLDQLGGTMANFGSLVSSHPKMKIVLTNVTYRIDRDLYPLMDKYDNFLLETSGYKPLEGIPMICEHFGAHRLVFGTGMPAISGPASLGLLVYAQIPFEQKQMIASKNLKKLLGGVRL